MWIVALFLFGLGVILVIAAPISKKKNNRCSATTQGTIVKEFETENSENMTGKAYVYSYNVEGIEYQITSTAQVKGVGGIGSECTIWYNPKKPKDAQPFHYESSKVFTIILIVGIVLLVIGLILGGYSCMAKYSDELSSNTTSNSTQSTDTTGSNNESVKTDIVGKWNATEYSYTKDGVTKNDDLPVLEFDNEGKVTWSVPPGAKDTGTWVYKNGEIMADFSDGTSIHGTVDGSTMTMSGTSGKYTLTLKLRKE